MSSLRLYSHGHQSRRVISFKLNSSRWYHQFIDAAAHLVSSPRFDQSVVQSVIDEGMARWCRVWVGIPTVPSQAHYALISGPCGWMGSGGQPGMHYPEEPHPHRHISPQHTLGAQPILIERVHTHPEVNAHVCYCPCGCLWHKCTQCIRLRSDRPLFLAPW